MRPPWWDFVLLLTYSRSISSKVQFFSIFFPQHSILWIFRKSNIFFFWNAQFHEFSVKIINFIHSCLSFSNTQIQEFSVKAIIFFFSETPNFTNFPWKQSILFILVFLQHQIQEFYVKATNFFSETLNFTNFPWRQSIHY